MTRQRDLEAVRRGEDDRRGPASAAARNRGCRRRCGRAPSGPATRRASPRRWRWASGRPAARSTLRDKHGAEQRRIERRPAAMPSATVAGKRQPQHVPAEHRGQDHRLAGKRRTARHRRDWCDAGRRWSAHSRRPAARRARPNAGRSAAAGGNRACAVRLARGSGSKRERGRVRI